MFTLVHVDTSLSLKCQPFSRLLSSHELVVSTDNGGLADVHAGINWKVGAGITAFLRGRHFFRTTGTPARFRAEVGVGFRF